MDGEIKADAARATTFLCLVCVTRVISRVWRCISGVEAGSMMWNVKLLSKYFILSHAIPYSDQREHRLIKNDRIIDRSGNCEIASSDHLRSLSLSLSLS